MNVIDLFKMSLCKELLILTLENLSYSSDVSMEKLDALFENFADAVGLT